jgi:hypothetical protein
MKKRRKATSTKAAKKPKMQSALSTNVRVRTLDHLELEDPDLHSFVVTCQLERQASRRKQTGHRYLRHMCLTDQLENPDNADTLDFCLSVCCNVFSNSIVPAVSGGITALCPNDACLVLNGTHEGKVGIFLMHMPFSSKSVPWDPDADEKRGHMNMRDAAKNNNSKAVLWLGPGKKEGPVTIKLTGDTLRVIGLNVDPVIRTQCTAATTEFLQLKVRQLEGMMKGIPSNALTTRQSPSMKAFLEQNKLDITDKHAILARMRGGPPDSWWGDDFRQLTPAELVTGLDYSIRNIENNLVVVRGQVARLEGKLEEEHRRNEEHRHKTQNFQRIMLETAGRLYVQRGWANDKLAQIDFCVNN